MVSIWFMKDTWGGLDQGQGGGYSGGSLANGGWPAPGGLLGPGPEANVNGIPAPRKDFGAIGAERKFGLVKPAGASSLMVEGGGPHARTWKEVVEASWKPKPNVPILGKSLLSADGAGGSGSRSSTASGILGGHQFNRDHQEEKVNYPPGLWGPPGGTKVVKEPAGEPLQEEKPKLNWGGELLWPKRAIEVTEEEVYGLMGEVVRRPVKYDAPYGGRSPLINESFGFSALSAPTSFHQCGVSCHTLVNDAYMKGFFEGRQTMTMPPPPVVPVPSMPPPPMLPTGGSQLNFHDFDWNSGLQSFAMGSVNTPATFGNYGPVAPPLKFTTEADAVGLGTGWSLGAGTSNMIYSSNSVGDGEGYDQLPESGINSWSSTYADTAKLGDENENDPLSR